MDFINIQCFLNTLCSLHSFTSKGENREDNHLKGIILYIQLSLNLVHQHIFFILKSQLSVYIFFRGKPNGVYLEWDEGNAFTPSSVERLKRSLLFLSDFVLSLECLSFTLQHLNHLFKRVSASEIKPNNGGFYFRFLSFIYFLLKMFLCHF